MKINGKKIKLLLDLIKENKKEYLGHVSKGLEVSHENGTKATIIKVFREKSENSDKKGDIKGMVVKYYDLDGNKKKEKISKEQFLKLFKINKKKSKKTIKGNKND